MATRPFLPAGRPRRAAPCPTKRGVGAAYVGRMNLYRRSARLRPQADNVRGRRQPPEADPGEGTNSVQHRPDPRAEPIPDGEHKYVPRSPYRTGNH